MSTTSDVKELKEEPVKLVTLFSKVDFDVTVRYGDTSIIVPPRGRASSLDSSKVLDLNSLGEGIVKKFEE